MASSSSSSRRLEPPAGPPLFCDASPNPGAFRDDVFARALGFGSASEAWSCAMKFLAPSKDFTGAAAERARLGGGPFTAGEVPAFPASAFSSGEDVRGAPSSGGEDSFRAPLAAEVRRCLGMTSMTIPAGARQVRPQPQGRFDSPKTLGLGTLYTATFLNFPAASGSGRAYPVAARVLTSKRLRWKRGKSPNLERYTSSVRVVTGARWCDSGQPPFRERAF